MDDLVNLFSAQASLWVLFGVSFLGGLISSISPCSLSMLPLIIGYIGGYSEDKPLKTLVKMIFFVLGASIVFSTIGIVCALTGKIFIGNPYFALVVASVILVMGLNILGIINFQLPVIIKEIPQYDLKFYPLIDYIY